VASVFGRAEMRFWEDYAGFYLPGGSTGDAGHLPCVAVGLACSKRGAVGVPNLCAHFLLFTFSYRINNIDFYNPRTHASAEWWPVWRKSQNA
jgi:hypothetical protein